METFCAELRKQLELSYQENPDRYAWPEEHLPEIFERMKAAIAGNLFHKDGPAFRRTCKALGIKHTYKAIAHFIANHK